MMLEADTVDDVESNKVLSVKVSLMPSSGVCVVSMHETVQSRNLGGPKYSCKGNFHQSKLRRESDDVWGVRCAHSTEEVE